MPIRLLTKICNKYGKFSMPSDGKSIAKRRFRSLLLSRRRETAVAAAAPSPALADLPQWRRAVGVARPCPTWAPPSERAPATRTVTGGRNGRGRKQERRGEEGSVGEGGLTGVHRRAICCPPTQTRHICFGVRVVSSATKS